MTFLDRSFFKSKRKKEDFDKTDKIEEIETKIEVENIKLPAILRKGNYVVSVRTTKNYKYYKSLGYRE